MGSAPPGHWKSLCITHLATCPNQNSPTDSADEAIGVGAELVPHVRAVPSGGRGIILTSDGIHSIPCGVFEWVVKHARQLQASTERLAQVSEWHGGHDNATAMAIGLSNGYSDREASGVVECWVPGEHLVLLQIAERYPRAAPTGMAPNDMLRTPAKQGAVDPPEPLTKVETDATKKRQSTRSKRNKRAGKKPRPDRNEDQPGRR